MRSANIVTPERIQREYERGRAWNSSPGLDLYETVRSNQAFYIGDQWRGCNAPDLDKPVLNFIKRVVSHFIAMIVSDDVAVSFEAKGGGASGAPFAGPEYAVGAGFGEGRGTSGKACAKRYLTAVGASGDEGFGARQVAELVSAEVAQVIENNDCKSKNRRLLRDAAINGDCCLYLSFDPEAESGQPIKGAVTAEVLENTQVIFGDPYTPEAQRQPYILLAHRYQLPRARELARQAGAAEAAVEGIRPDFAPEGWSGEESGAEEELATFVTRMWRENGTVRSVTVCGGSVVRPETDTGLRLYPVAWMNWEPRRGSYHGVSPITYQKPNQMFVNKMWALGMRQVMLSAFPKTLYDSTRIARWSNAVGEAIAVAGDPSQAVFSSWRGADMSGQVLQLVDATIQYTKDFMGASDAALGDVDPENTSAIIAVQEASSMPLELQRLAFHQLVEDYVRIIVDMIRVYYGPRWVRPEERPGESLLFDFSSVDYPALQLKVDVGASTYWSELMQVQTMDNLFASGVITDAALYLENIPDEYLRNKHELIAAVRASAPKPAGPEPRQERGYGRF